MISESFRATRAYEEVQGLSTLPNVNVQDFDARWNHALLSASNLASDVIMELENSVQLQTVMALRDQETVIRTVTN